MLRYYKAFLPMILLLSEVSLACSPGIYQDPQYHLKITRIDSNKDGWTTFSDKDGWTTFSDNEQDGEMDRGNTPLVSINEDKEVLLLVKSNYSSQYKQFTNLGMTPFYKVKDQKHYIFDFSKDEWIENQDGFFDFRKYGKILINLSIFEQKIIESFPSFIYQNEELNLTTISKSVTNYIWNLVMKDEQNRRLFLLLTSGNQKEELQVMKTTVDIMTSEVEYKIANSRITRILRYPSYNYKTFVYYLNFENSNEEKIFFVKNGREFDKYIVPEGYLLFSNLNCKEKGKCMKLEKRGLSKSLLSHLKSTTGYEDHFHFSDNLYELKDGEKKGQMSIPAMIDGKFVEHLYRLEWSKNKTFKTTKSKWESSSCSDRF